MAAAVYAGYRVVQWPGFALAAVRVSGERVTPRSEIVRSAALAPGGNIWQIGRAHV